MANGGAYALTRPCLTRTEEATRAGPVGTHTHAHKDKDKEMRGERGDRGHSECAARVCQGYHGKEVRDLRRRLARRLSLLHTMYGSRACICVRPGDAPDLVSSMSV